VRAVSRPFRFAVQKRGFDDPDEIADYARHVEALGYEELYSYDHIGAVDPFVPLVPAARATERLRVGPLVLNNELHHPALLARTAATVDRMTGGRLVLGLGTGYAQDEHDAIGLELRPPGDRVTRFGESVEIVRRLLDDGGAQFAGDHHRIALDALGVRPVQDRVPILIGGFGRRVLTIAARFADIFQFTGLSDAPDGSLAAGGFALGEVVERARWLTDAAGERDQAIERSSLVQVVAIGDDAPSDDELATRFDIDPAIVGDSPFVLTGSVAAVVDKLERIRAATGISHYVIREPDAFAPVVDALAGR
jgi:probable F420-dependent oxidoreductase